MTITRADFLREQYISLREEIKDTKDRIFKIAAIGLFILPAGQYIVHIMEAEIFLLFLPFVVISVALLYLSENHSLMRCGRYIRLHIEPEIQNLIGWENWLESQDSCDPRTVDRYVAYAIYVVSAAYCVIHRHAGMSPAQSAEDRHILLHRYHWPNNDILPSPPAFDC